MSHETYYSSKPWSILDNQEVAVSPLLPYPVGTRTVGGIIGDSVHTILKLLILTLPRKFLVPICLASYQAIESEVSWRTGNFKEYASKIGMSCPVDF